MKKLLFALGCWCLAATATAGTFQQISSFGSNPGSVAMYLYTPSTLQSPAPVVVAIHGCTQNAQEYNDKSGWSDMAEQYGYYVIYPEQNASNNMNKCWNFYQTSDNRRGSGEAQSIKSMVDWVVSNKNVDTSKIYVTGVSSGAVFTDVMAAAYPDVFAGMAPNAGIPAYCANDVLGGFSCMQGVSKSASQWANLVYSDGYDCRSNGCSYPIAVIWHGSSDTDVDPSNLTEEMKQWTALHGIDQSADATTTVGDDTTRNDYTDGSGNYLVSTFLSAGMTHGTQVDPSNGCGVAGKYYLDEGICTAKASSEYWCITGSASCVVGQNVSSSSSSSSSSSTSSSTSSSSTSTGGGSNDSWFSYLQDLINGGGWDWWSSNTVYPVTTIPVWGSQGYGYYAVSRQYRLSSCSYNDGYNCSYNDYLGSNPSVYKMVTDVGPGWQGLSYKNFRYKMQLPTYNP